MTIASPQPPDDPRRCPPNYIYKKLHGKYDYTYKKHTHAEKCMDLKFPPKNN